MKQLHEKKISDFGVPVEYPRGERMYELSSLKEWIVEIVKKIAKENGINFHKKYWDIGRVKFLGFGRFRLNWRELDSIQLLIEKFELTEDDLK